MGYPVYYNGLINVAPPLSKTHARVVEDVINFKETEETRPILSAIKSSEEPDLPGYGGQFYVSEDGTTLYPEDEESRHGLRLWLVLLLKHFFVPNGYTLNGDVTFETSEDVEDRGAIYIQNNELESTDVLLFDPGPSWNPNHYADCVLKEAIQILLDSADATGCSEDLTVVASAALDRVRQLVGKIA